LRLSIGRAGTCNKALTSLDKGFLGLDRFVCLFVEYFATHFSEDFVVGF